MKYTLSKKKVLLALPYLLSFSFSFYLFSFLKMSSFVVSNSTDSSWQYALSGLRHSTQHLGVDIYFTYGPLFEVLPTFIHSSDTFLNFIVGTLLFLYITAINAWIFLKLYKIILLYGAKKWLRLALLCTVAVLFFTLGDIDTAFNISLIATIFVIREEKKYYMKLLLFSAAYLMAFYKFSYFIPVIVLTPFVFIDKINIKNLLRSAVLSLGPGIMAILIFILLTQQMSITGFFKFIYYCGLNTIGYGEFMGLPYSDFPLIVLFYLMVFAIAVLSFLLVFFLIFKNTVKLKNNLGTDSYIIISLSFLLITFFDFKHAVVRSDIHLLSFTPFIFLCLIFVLWNIQLMDRKYSLLSKINYKKAFVIICCSSAILHVIILMHLLQLGVATSLSKQKDYILASIKQTSTENRFSYDVFLKNRELSNKNITQRSDEIKLIRSKLKDLPNQKKPLIFYGNTNLYGEILKKDRTVLYPPFLQNYVAYPPKLGDSLYINFLKNNPDALLYIDENEASIDRRIPSHEVNNFFQYALHNYRLVAADETRHQYVLEPFAHRDEVCKIIKTLTFNDNMNVNLDSLPNTNKNQYIKLIAKSDHNPITSGVSLLLKNPVYSLLLFNPEGVYASARTTRSTLEHGVVIKPLNQSYTDVYLNQPFRVRSFVIQDGFPLTTTYTSTFEMCTFE